MELYADSYAEAAGYFPRPAEFKLGPEDYLDQIRRIKAAVNVPVIASLNGTTRTGWLQYAGLIEDAGADALELNVYHVATDPDETGEAVEQRVIDLATEVRRAVSIPLAVKLSPDFSSLSNLTYRLETCGVDGFVLFNRFYQPDIDLENLEAAPYLRLSDSSELLLRLQWLAIISSHSRASLAVSGGVHTALDALKAIAAGASAVQIVSALLRNGPGCLRAILDDVNHWLYDHEYESIGQLRGSMNLSRCPDPRAFERGNYKRILQSWRPTEVVG
jgi:dihydroorotate dehydrogenase (fumarate)